MYVKTHKTKKGGTLVAVCDEDILGKKLEEGRKYLDLTGDFYNGEKKNPKETADLMRNADLINLVGEQAIKIAADEELISPDAVKRIDGVPIFQSMTEGS